MRAWLTVFLFFASLVTAQALVIENHVHWQGEVQLDDVVIVAKSGKLTVAPGTRVTSRYRIEVLGELQASEAEFSGLKWPGLLLKNTGKETYLRKCRITGADTGITVLGGSPQLEELVLAENRVGVELRQKSTARVTGSTFRRNQRVGLFVKDEAAPLVLDNLFEEQGKFGAYIYRSVPKRFIGNRFVKNPVGLMVSHFGSNPEVTANRFTSNSVAIKVDRAARPKLTANRIVANDLGIDLARRVDPQIEKNLFQDNRQAIRVRYSSYPVIQRNDFSANGQALVLEFQSSVWEASKGAQARATEVSRSGAFGGQKQDQVSEQDRRAVSLDGTVDAKNNWWGEAETRLLQKKQDNKNLAWIVDGFDQPFFEEEGQQYPLDRVLWSPYSATPFTRELEP